jgi:DEAD/DEAH box helicase domain-containing protein
MSFSALLEHWRKDPLTAPNLPIWRTSPPRLAEMRPFPADLPAILGAALDKRGIHALYCHQALAWEAARAGENVVLATGTASGKTLGYNLPVLAAWLEDPAMRALYLFPTKALTQDQLAGLTSLQSEIKNLKSAIYDGDTPQSNRSTIRRNASLIFTNPDMLHTGILPHHTNWADFFRNLRFVIIDEMHTYRGVFGSHFANVIRRLKRVAAFYGATPQFILTSATIGNPQELAGRLIEAPATLIDQDGSSRGERHFLIYNPPVLDEALGLRKSSLLESVRLSQELNAHNIQHVIFARSRRSVEILLKYLQEQGNQLPNSPGSSSPNPPPPIPSSPDLIRGYRSGYLPSQRRSIEKGLRDGTVRAVVATNALELGIDIGGLGAALLVGYPGTIASTWQQAGRAGRGDDPALAVFVASANPLDQFLAHHPDYFFGRSPEQALVNPDHLIILLNHLRCAMFELPFQKGEGFGSLPAGTVQEYLDFLVTGQEAHLSQEKYFWMADSYPAAGLSLRSASPENVVLQVQDGQAPWVLGEVDMASAPWMVHPRAVYLHEGQQYFVQELDLAKQTAALIPVSLDYYTEPQRQTEVKILSVVEQADLPAPTGIQGRRPPTPSPFPLQGEGGNNGNLDVVSGETVDNIQISNSIPPYSPGLKGWGELQVTLHVAGFKKLRWFTRENLGLEPLDLPPTDFQTTGYWLSLSETALEQLRASGAWTGDPNDYGPGWNRLREVVRRRDGYRCQVCGLPENGRQHDVHHKVPFRAFTDFLEANRMENLITLCPACHRKTEQNVRMRSGLAGLGSLLGQLAPLFLMCDPGDLGIHTDPTQATLGQPGLVIYDDVPGGIGFSQRLFELHDELMQRALELVQECECKDGCPSCVGPGGENGLGGKAETLEILKLLQAGTA